MNNKKIRFTSGFDFYKDYNTAPITEIAESLGLKIDNYNKICCPCPNHDDQNPSTTLTTSGKYENTFKCWSCGEKGDALSLVIAVKNGIAPSEYFNTLKNGTVEEKEKMISYRDDAAIYIDSIFPGNIEYVNGNEKSKKEKRPHLPKWIEEEIGLHPYFDKPRTIKIKENGKTKNIKMDGLSEYEAADIILGKLFELQSNLKEYQNKIFKDFPELDGKAKFYIMDTIDNKIDTIDVYVGMYQVYLNYEINNEIDERIQSGNGYVWETEEGKEYELQ